MYHKKCLQRSVYKYYKTFAMNNKLFTVLMRRIMSLKKIYLLSQYYNTYPACALFMLSREIKLTIS